MHFDKIFIQKRKGTYVCLLKIKKCFILIILKKERIYGQLEIKLISLKIMYQILGMMVYIFLVELMLLVEELVHSLK